MAKLRDRREPGHFWADNEIIDVFGDELGQNGISVYMTMTRFCYGTEVRLSLREIAAAARMSKDTVARSMKVLVAVGLVIEAKGAKAKTVSTWSLANVKALVQSYVKQSVSLTVSQGDRLPVSQMREPLRQTAQTTLVQVLKDTQANCLSGRQFESAAESVDKKFCVAQDETELSQTMPGFETDLSQNEGSHLYSKTQDTKLQDKTPLPPSGSKGDVAHIDWVSCEPSAIENKTKYHPVEKLIPEDGAKHCEEAVRKVMRELNLTERRMVAVIARAIEGYRAKTDAPPNCNAVAELMVKARQEFVHDLPLMRCPVGIRKFLSLGVWADRQQWPYDDDKLRQVRRL